MKKMLKFRNHMERRPCGPNYPYTESAPVSCSSHTLSVWIAHGDHWLIGDSIPEISPLEEQRDIHQPDHYWHLYERSDHSRKRCARIDAKHRHSDSDCQLKVV